MCLICFVGLLMQTMPGILRIPLSKSSSTHHDALWIWWDELVQEATINIQYCAPDQRMNLRVDPDFATEDGVYIYRSPSAFGCGPSFLKPRKC
jgi:hypothetical protein